MTLVDILRVLRRLTSIELVTSMMYRAQFAVYMISTVVTTVVGLFIWTTIEASGANLPVDRKFLVSYYLMLAVVQMLASTWHSEYLATVIRNGELNSWLVRPGSYLLNLVANNLAEKVVKLMAILPLLGLIWLPYRESFAVPTDFDRWLLFAPAVAGAAVINFSLVTAVGSLGFWLDDNTGIARSQHMIRGILSGQIVPLALYPEWSQGLLQWQPFRFVLSFPLEILLADIETRALLLGFTSMALWAVAFVALSYVTWQRGIRAYNAVGA